MGQINQLFLEISYNWAIISMFIHIFFIVYIKGAILHEIHHFFLHISYATSVTFLYSVNTSQIDRFVLLSKEYIGACAIIYSVLCHLRYFK